MLEDKPSSKSKLFEDMQNVCIWIKDVAYYWPYKWWKEMDLVCCYRKSLFGMPYQWWTFLCPYPWKAELTTSQVPRYGILQIVLNTCDTLQLLDLASHGCVCMREWGGAEKITVYIAIIIHLMYLFTAFAKILKQYTIGKSLLWK